MTKKLRCKQTINVKSTGTQEGSEAMKRLFWKVLYGVIISVIAAVIGYPIKKWLWPEKQPNAPYIHTGPNSISQISTGHDANQTIKIDMSQHVDKSVHIAMSPTDDTTGLLRPRDPNVSDSQDQTPGGSFDTGTGILTIGSKNITYQPFGQYVPFFVTRTDDRISISAEFYNLDLDNNVVAEIINNRWTVNRNNYFRKVFDGSLLEVVDNHNMPVLQVEYINPYTAKVGGIFRAEKKSAALLYPHLPVVDRSFTPAMFIVPPNSLVVIGGGAMQTLPVPSNMEELEEARAAARERVQPWFPYEDVSPK